MIVILLVFFFFFSSRRRHTRLQGDWSSDVCSSDLRGNARLELQQQGEHFRVLDPPSLPVKPYSPKRLQLCAIGLVVGLLLSGAATAGAELLDDRIHDEKTLKKLIQIPVLSEIPNVSTDTETRAERRDGWLVCATASMMVVSILAGSALSYFRG